VEGTDREPAIARVRLETLKRPTIPTVLNRSDLQGNRMLQNLSTSSAETVKGKPAQLPLSGIRVVEFCHIAMGPTVGLLLAELGADVIKVEPLPTGDRTR